MLSRVVMAGYIQRQFRKVALTPSGLRKWKARLLAVSSSDGLGVGVLQYCAPAVVAKKLNRTTKVKIDEHNPQKRKVGCLIKREVNLIDDSVDEKQKRTSTTALPYTIPQRCQDCRINDNPRMETRCCYNPSGRERAEN